MISLSLLMKLRLTEIVLLEILYVTELRSEHTTVLTIVTYAIHLLSSLNMYLLK